MYCSGDHVMYAPECDGESNECFDLACPASHPVTMPEIHLYVRVQDYEGGAHMFADGSDVRSNTNRASNEPSRRFHGEGLLGLLLVESAYWGFHI